MSCGECIGACTDSTCNFLLTHFPIVLYWTVEDAMGKLLDGTWCVFHQSNDKNLCVSCEAFTWQVLCRFWHVTSADIIVFSSCVFSQIGEMVVYEPLPAYEHLFGDILGTCYSDPTMAFDMVMFCRDNLQKLCMETHILEKFFPNLLKVRFV